MITNIPLLVTNVSYGIFFAFTVMFGIWAYLKSSRKIAHIMFLFVSLAVGIFQICHIFGVNVIDGEASRDILMGSLSVIFIICFTIHWILAVLEKDKEKWKSLLFFYVVGVGLVAFFVSNPDFFLLSSVPKMYLPDYYEAGKYYWLLPAYFILGAMYAIYALIRAYRIADPAHKNRLRYYILSIVVGFPAGATAFPLAMNIPFDPIYSTLFSFYIVPMAYGILRYDIMDITIVAKKAVSYAALVTAVGFFVAGINGANAMIQVAYPWLPGWIIPLTSAVIAVFVGGFVWEKVRDTDILKYEFVTVVTHKFRTPLTRIKWASEMLRKRIEGSADQEAGLAVDEIDNANELLVELTDMLVGLKKSDDVKYLYSFEESDMCKAVERATKGMSKHVQDKKLEFVLTCDENVPLAMLDVRRMQFALQIIVENAVTYTPAGGKVSVSVKKDGGNSIEVQVSDTGMGISRDDLQRIFTKFFRSKDAKTTDTEGMGIGLFMAKQIIERHDGSVSVSSDGVGKGSTFTVKVPGV
ncbi:MAG: ATP-binding protein [Candidatus Paceibacterota bacterium]|jgi:signal transduction histidine kinase